MKQPEPRESMDLHAKYPGLNTADYVETAAVRTRGRSQDPKALLDQDPNARIANYLNRVEEIFSYPDPDIKEKLIAKFKQDLHARYILKTHDSQSQREIGEQTESLDAWVDALGEDDEFPTWLKFWIMRSVVRMGRFNKETKKFKVRDAKTKAPFPEIDKKALRLVMEMMRDKYASKIVHLAEGLTPEEKKAVNTALDKEKFADLYETIINKMKPIPEELLVITDGQWKHFSVDNPVSELTQSLDGYGTNWCLRLEAAAQNYLVTNRYQLDIFYSNDQDGEAKIPRAVLVTGYDSLLEVCGVESAEELLDRNIIPVVREKLSQMPKNERWQKACDDTEKLYALEEKNKQKEVLSIDELVFLYERDKEINGFGLKSHPLIPKLKENRDIKSDLSYMLEVEPAHIATTENEITPETRVYAGPFTPGIFKKLSNIEYLFATSPRWRRVPLCRLPALDKVSIDDLKNNLKNSGFEITDDAEELLRKNDLPDNDRSVLTARFRLSELVPKGQTITRDDFAPFEKLGLEKCWPVDALLLRTVITDQPDESFYYLGMEPVKVIDRKKVRQSSLVVQTIKSTPYVHRHIFDADKEWKQHDEIFFRIPDCD